MAGATRTFSFNSRKRGQKARKFVVVASPKYSASKPSRACPSSAATCSARICHSCQSSMSITPPPRRAQKSEEPRRGALHRAWQVGVTDGARTHNHWSHNPELCLLSYGHHGAPRPRGLSRYTTEVYHSDAKKGSSSNVHLLLGCGRNLSLGVIRVAVYRLPRPHMHPGARSRRRIPLSHLRSPNQDLRPAGLAQAGRYSVDRR